MGCISPWTVQKPVNPLKGTIDIIRDHPPEERLPDRTMAQLTAGQRVALTQLIARCPDHVLSKLELAVAEMAGPRAEAVRLMFTAELCDRMRRAQVFRPLLPLFAPRADTMPALTFPAELLDQLWKAAKRNEPELLPQLDRDDDLSRMIADRLCFTAAAAMRDNGRALWPQASQSERDALARVLDLAGVARTSVRRLPDWQARVAPDAAAEMKLAIRQAAAIGHDGPERLMEIYFSHLREGLQVLRLASHASSLGTPPTTLIDGPYTDFVERVIQSLEAKTERLLAFDLSEGPQGVLDFRDRLQWVAAALSEIELVVIPRPDSVWARTLRHCKLRLTQSLSERFKAAAKIVDALLPQERTAMSGRMTRASPRLIQALDDSQVETARLLMGILAVSRGPANVLGCEAERRQTVEGITGRIASWADEALDRLNRKEALDGGQIARRRLQVLVDLLQLAGAKDAARTVRRRLANTGAASGISLRRA